MVDQVALVCAIRNDEGAMIPPDEEVLPIGQRELLAVSIRSRHVVSGSGGTIMTSAYRTAAQKDRLNVLGETELRHTRVVIGPPDGRIRTAAGASSCLPDRNNPVIIALPVHER